MHSRGVCLSRWKDLQCQTWVRTPLTGYDTMLNPQSYVNDPTFYGQVEGLFGF